MPNRQLRILGMPCDSGGCGWYRVRQPFQFINDYTLHEAVVLDPAHIDPADAGKAILAADVLVVRQGGEEGIRKLKSMPEFRHIRWALDIDDNIELISPYSQHYEEYGTAEFFDPGSKTWVWKDGVGKFNLAKNRMRVASLLAGMAEADLVTATTERLADYARRYNPNVAVLPNCVDTTAWRPLPLRSHRPLRVGWWGGVSHYEDLYTIRRPLNRLLAKHGCTLVMIGAHFDGLIDPGNRHLVEVHPWVPFAAHPYRSMTLGLDVAIIPLADLPFNRYKSSVKWYEAAAMGVPAVVANVPPYGDEIDERVAAPYRTPDQFEYQLDTLLSDPAKRGRLAQTSRHWVVQHRDMATNAMLWAEAYRSILNP